MATKKSKAAFVAGWDCWVRWDRDYPEKPSPSFVAGYKAAAHDNDHGGGSRPEIAQDDDSCELYWKRYANHVVEQPMPVVRKS
jgi:hypothetical protein